MAFLDNSGDIILDAVLTEVGRKKLGRGASLNIQNFALGDDEINYGLFDLTVESALSDLEILQTPVLESVTARPAGVNHGLLRMVSAADILYLPVTKVNPKRQLHAAPAVITSELKINTAPVDNVFLIAANAETATSLGASATITTSKLYGQRDWVQGYLPGSPKDAAIVFESGLNTRDLPKDLFGDGFTVNLRDTSYTFSLDKRLFSGGTTGVNAGGGPAIFTDTVTGIPHLGVKMTPRIFSAVTYGGTEAYNYGFIEAAGLPTNLYISSGPATVPLTDITMIDGPTTTSACIAPTAQPHLQALVTDILYTQLGTGPVTSDSLFNDSDSTTKYYYIDSFMYVAGTITGASTQVALRLIKKA